MRPFNFAGVRRSILMDPGSRQSDVPQGHQIDRLDAILIPTPISITFTTRAAGQKFKPKVSIFETASG